MKSKNYLVAQIKIDGSVSFHLECRKLANGKYRWYGDDGSGARNLGIPLSVDLEDAKVSLLATYPPDMYSMTAKWLR